MQSVDFRDATFEGLRGSLETRRRLVYEAWVALGPGTTDLLQMGLVKVVGRRGNEGIYQAAAGQEWEEFRQSQVSGQQLLI